MNYLSRKKQMYVHFSGFMHPSKQSLYCQVQLFQVGEWYLKYHFQHHQNYVIDGLRFELLECHRTKQLFLAAGFYILWLEFSHGLRSLFIDTFNGFFWPAVWIVVLLGFDAPEIKVTVCSNTFHNCLPRRRARNYLLMQHFGIRVSMQLPCPLLPIWFLLKKR